MLSWSINSLLRIYIQCCEVFGRLLGLLQQLFGTIPLVFSLRGNDPSTLMWFFHFSRPRPAGDEWDPWSLPWVWASFLTNSAGGLYFFFPSFRRLQSLLSGVPSFSVFTAAKTNFEGCRIGCLCVWKMFWKVASLGVVVSLSPAVFFLWLYYTTP